MAKLGSSSGRSLLQGMMLLALLLLASIQAGPVMAWEEQAAVADLRDLGEWLGDQVRKKGPEMVANRFLTELGKEEPDWKDFSDGGKKGIKAFKYLCKAQRWMDKLNPGGGGTGTGTPCLVDTLATSLGRGGDLSRSFPIFSYFVTSQGDRGNSGVFCWFPRPPAAAGSTTSGARATTTLVPITSRYLNDGRYYVRMSSIRVGQEVLRVPTLAPPAYLYLSTTQPFTYLESGLYDSLTAAVILQMKLLNPGAGATRFPTTADKVCYAAATAAGPLRFPRIAIRLASHNVMPTMEMGGATATDTVWYQESSMWMCLGIRRATMEEPPVLGSMIQSGRTMTIDLTAAGGQGTLSTNNTHCTWLAVALFLLAVAF